MRWEIKSNAQTFGTYEGETALEAARTFYHDAGYDTEVEHGMLVVDAEVPLKTLCMEGENGEFTTIGVIADGGKNESFE